jgi:hypothetical protein
LRNGALVNSSHRTNAVVNSIAAALVTGGLTLTLSGVGVSGQAPPNQSRVLATSKTSTLEKELNDAADAGFRFAAVMGGETAIGGKEVVAIVSRTSEGAAGRYSYRLLATTRTSTMEKEIREAADAGFEYRGQTVFESLFGGQEVVVILERDREERARNDYKLVATSRTSTLEKELLEAGAAGYAVVGMTVAKTAMGGKELVAILKRTVSQ